MRYQRTSFSDDLRRSESRKAVIGGGGLGAIALQYGYYRYQKDVLWTTVILLIVMVMIIQEIGIILAKKKRKS